MSHAYFIHLHPDHICSWANLYAEFFFFHCFSAEQGLLWTKQTSNLKASVQSTSELSLSVWDMDKHTLSFLFRSCGRSSFWVLALHETLNSATNWFNIWNILKDKLMYTFGRSLEHAVISCWAVIVVDAICDFSVISHVIFKLLLWRLVLQFHWLCGVCWFCVAVVHAFRSKPVEVSGKESMWFLLGVIMKMVKFLPSLLIYTATDLGGHEFGHVYKLRGNPCHHRGGSLEGQGYSSFIQTGGCCHFYCWPRKNVWLEPPVSKQACKQASKTFGECTLSCSQQFWWDMMRLDHCCYCHLNFLE